MDWTAETLAKARHLLAEEACTLVSMRHARRRRLTRRWPRISDTDRTLCEAYLAEFASAENLAPTRFVTEPKVDGGRERLPGRWKMVRTDLTATRTDAAAQGVYQTLVEWPEGEGDADGAWCAESSPLHHEDVEVRYDASDPFDCAHEIEAGVIYHASANWNDEDGCWQTEKRTDRARAPGKYRTHSGTFFERSWIEKGEHRPAGELEGADAVAAQVAAHKTVANHADMDSYALLSTTKTVSEGIPWSVSTVTDEPTETVRTTRFGNQPEKPADTAPVRLPDGSVRTTHHDVRPNEYGLFDGTTVIRTSKAGSVSYKGAAGKYSTSTVTQYWNQPSVPHNIASGYVAGDPGKYVERTVSGVRLNDFGLWDYTLTETTTTCSVSGRNYVTKGKGRWHKLIYGYNVAAIPAEQNTDPNALVNPDGRSVRLPIYGLVETAEKHWVRTKVFTDEAAAYSWIAGGALNSHVSQVDGHWFLAVRVDHSAQAGVNYQGA